MKHKNNTSAIIQLTAGRGPAECCWVVAKVLKAFLSDCKSYGMDYTFLHSEAGSENRTIQSVTVQIHGDNTTELLSTWLGTIQWIGTSSFRKYHKRKNWFVGMFEVDLPSEVKLDLKEVQFQAIRSSGPGGQHVNKVSSAIRANHLPTGTFVVVMDTRSQHQNKKIAIERLTEKLSDLHKAALKKQATQHWENHLQLQRGNPIRVFKGSDFKQEKREKTRKLERLRVKNNLKKELWD